jgi:hypothetical protein
MIPSSSVAGLDAQSLPERPVRLVSGLARLEPLHIGAQTPYLGTLQPTIVDYYPKLAPFDGQMAEYRQAKMQAKF